MENANSMRLSDGKEVGFIPAEPTDTDLGGITLQERNQIETNKTDINKIKTGLNTLNDGGLILKDEIIREDVKEWLVEHPEAIRVEDKSISKEKLSDDVFDAIQKTDSTLYRNKLDIGEHASFYLQDTSHKSVQSFTIAGEYIIWGVAKNDETYNVFYRMKFPSFTELERFEIKECVGHCNSMTYDSKSGYVLCTSNLNNPAIYVIDPKTMTWVKNINSPNKDKSANAIAMNKDGSLFAIKNSKYIYVYQSNVENGDYNFSAEPIYQFETDVTQTRQSLCFTNENNIIISNYEMHVEGTNYQETLHPNIKSSGTLIIYNLYGKTLNRMILTKDFGEIEDIEIYGNKIFINYNYTSVSMSKDYYLEMLCSALLYNVVDTDEYSIYDNPMDKNVVSSETKTFSINKDFSDNYLVDGTTNHPFRSFKELSIYLGNTNIYYRIIHLNIIGECDGITWGNSIPLQITVPTSNTGKVKYLALYYSGRCLIDGIEIYGNMTIPNSTMKPSIYLENSALSVRNVKFTCNSCTTDVIRCIALSTLLFDGGSNSFNFKNSGTLNELIYLENGSEFMERTLPTIASNTSYANYVSACKNSKISTVATNIGKYNRDSSSLMFLNSSSLSTVPTIQKGTVLKKINAGCTDISVNFDKKLDKAPSMVFVQIYSNSDGYADYANLTHSVLNITQSGFTIRVYYNGVSQRQPIFQWIAID